jgi:hypothetical protein
VAVAKDAIGTDSSIPLTANASGNYTALNVVSNTNGAILVLTTAADLTNANNNALSSVTGYTKIGTATSSDLTVRCELWGKVGNSTGAQTIVVTAASTWVGNTPVVVAAISVIGANQTGGVTTFANFAANTGTSNAPSTGAITTSTSDLVAAVMAVQDTINSGSATSIYLDNATNPSCAAQYEQNGASPQTLTWSDAGSVPWAVAAVDIVGAGGAATVVSSTPRLLMGVGI